MKACKGFDKNLRCRGFQYEVGGEYTEETAELCNRGPHACENPLDTLRYYRPGDSRYCEVEIEDNGQRSSYDSKVCGKHIKIGAEIGLKGVINAGVRFVFDKCESATEENASGWRGNAAASGERGNAAASGWRGNAAASGERGNAAASGWSGNAAASGWRGNAAASGDSGNAAASGWSGTAVVTGFAGRATALGEQCLAVAWGEDSLARGTVGNWIVVSERDDDGNIIDVKIAKVDGDTVKADTWYKLVNGEIMEA
ncbi:MAG: hypothetical protein ACLRI6_12700 [Oscillospiraceae bacterium]